MENVVIFYDHLVKFMAFWYCLWAKKNLATLVQPRNKSFRLSENRTGVSTYKVTEQRYVPKSTSQGNAQRAVFLKRCRRELSA
jgi:hypothetical protein